MSVNQANSSTKALVLRAFLEDYLDVISVKVGGAS
jgi:hypothetical protein